MRILIYGADVIGSIFAAKLSLSGQDVTVLARGKRFEEISSQGVVIYNPKTNNKEVAKELNTSGSQLNCRNCYQPRPRQISRLTGESFNIIKRG